MINTLWFYLLLFLLDVTFLSFVGFYCTLFAIEENIGKQNSPFPGGIKYPHRSFKGESDHVKNGPQKNHGLAINTMRVEKKTRWDSVKWSWVYHTCTWHSHAFSRKCADMFFQIFTVFSPFLAYIFTELPDIFPYFPWNMDHFSSVFPGKFGRSNIWSRGIRPPEVDISRSTFRGRHFAGEFQIGNIWNH